VITVTAVVPLPTRELVAEQDSQSWMFNGPSLVASDSMTASGSAAATQTRVREPDVPVQDFTLDALPATIVTIYRAWDRLTLY